MNASFTSKPYTLLNKWQPNFQSLLHLLQTNIMYKAQEDLLAEIHAHTCSFSSALTMQKS